MVSIKSLVSIGTIAAVGLAGLWLVRGGAATIGNALGGGLSSIGSGFSNAFTTGLGLGGGANESENGQTLQGIIAQEGLHNQVTNVPENPIPVPLTPLERGRLSLAGFLETNSLAGNIDIQTGVFRNQFTTQDLDFVIDPNTGSIKTGTIGIGSATLAAQRELSARYGIPTFDTKGNLSTFGGFASGQR